MTTEPLAAANSLRDRLVRLTLHLLLIAGSILMLYPLIWMFVASIRPESEIFTSSSLWPSAISFESYSRGWNALRVGFGTFFTNSAIIAVLSVIGNVVSCSLAAYAFARI